MKKTFLFLALLLTVSLSRAGLHQTPSLWSDNPHIEFKYYGFYGVIDYTFVHNFSHESPQYLNPATGQLVGFVDSYTLNGITAVAGWQWRKETALGFGFSYLNDAQGSFSQIPVFLEFRSHFLRNRITPFTVVQMGYSIPFGSKNMAEEYTRIDKGGITFAIEGGARFAVSQKLGLNVYVGFQMIQLNSVERGFNLVASTKMPELYRNVKFGLGINF